MKASTAPAGRGKAPRERRLSWKLRIKLDRAAGEASLLDPPSSDDEDAAPELVAEANSIEKICDARTQGGGARLALGGTGPQQYLCKFKGRAHVHARWLTAEEIAVDGRLSLQRLQHFDRKRAEIRKFHTAAGDAVAPVRPPLPEGIEMLNAATSEAFGLMHGTTPGHAQVILEHGLDERLSQRALVVALALAVRRVHTSEAGGEGLLHELGRSVALVRRRVNQLGHLHERAVRRRHFKE